MVSHIQNVGQNPIEATDMDKNIEKTLHEDEYSWEMFLFNQNKIGKEDIGVWTHIIHTLKENL